MTMFEPIVFTVFVFSTLFLILCYLVQRAIAGPVDPNGASGGAEGDNKDLENSDSTENKDEDMDDTNKEDNTEDVNQDEEHDVTEVKTTDGQKTEEKKGAKPKIREPTQKDMGLPPVYLPPSNFDTMSLNPNQRTAWDWHQPGNTNNTARIPKVLQKTNVLDNTFNIHLNASGATPPSNKKKTYPSWNGQTEIFNNRSEFSGTWGQNQPSDTLYGGQPVSYTHLTLPTSDLV